MKSFKVGDYEGANKFLQEQPIKGEMKLHDGYLCVFYEIDDKDNRSNRVQYLRGMAEAHFKKQWEYEEQMWMGVELRDLFDKEKQPREWAEGNKNVITTAKMLEMEILTTKVVLRMLKKLGVEIEQPEVEFPKIELPPEPITMNQLEDKMNKNADKKRKA